MQPFTNVQDIGNCDEFPGNVDLSIAGKKFLLTGFDSDLQIEELLANLGAKVVVHEECVSQGTRPSTGSMRIHRSIDTAEDARVVAEEADLWLEGVDFVISVVRRSKDGNSIYDARAIDQIMFHLLS